MFRVPLSGSFENTSGNVMYRPPSSGQHVRIGSSGGQLGNVVNVIARATKCVHYLALDAFVREVAHSSAYGIDHIKTKDVDGVLDSRQCTLPSQRWIGIEYLVDGLAA